MSITNDERRHAVEFLRTANCSDVACADCQKVSDALFGKVYVNALCNLDDCSDSEPWRRLADLIEPEERTCRVVTDKNTVSQTQEIHTKYCSKCSYVFGREQHRQLLPGLDEEFVLHAVQIPDYCPGCGAKVVAE